MKDKEFNINQCHEALFPFAFRVLNSVEDARDAAQDVILEYISSNNEHIFDPRNYLIKSVINKSINKKKRDQKSISENILRKEIVANDKTDSKLNLEDVMSISLQILTNKLNIKERAVFILKEAFFYSHEEIGLAISITPENSRKLLSRSKSKLKSANLDLNTVSTNDKTIKCLKSFMKAIKDRDLIELKKLLDISNN